MDENPENTKLRPNLKLLSSQDLTPSLVYGIIFNTLVDEIDVIRARAADHYQAALKFEINPANMQSDYALEELGFATRSNISTIDGSPVFNYLTSTNSCEHEFDDNDDDFPA